MRSQHALSCFVVFTLVYSTASGAPFSVSYSDGTFNNADWMQYVVVDSVGSTTSNGQANTSGNPTFHRQLASSYSGSTSGVKHQSIFLTDAVFDPSTLGSITNILYSEDVRYFSGTGKAGGSLFGAGMALRQNGTLYTSIGWGLGNYSNTDTNRWYSVVDYTLGTYSFSRVSPTGPTSPDFSSTGAPIEFGYWMHSYFTGPGSLVGGIDNWKVTVNYVPEPATYVLAITGIAGLALTGMRSKFAAKRVKTIC